MHCCRPHPMAGPLCVSFPCCNFCPSLLSHLCLSTEHCLLFGYPVFSTCALSRKFSHVNTARPQRLASAGPAAKAPPRGGALEKALPPSLPVRACDRGLPHLWSAVPLQAFAACEGGLSERAEQTGRPSPGLICAAISEVRLQGRAGAPGTLRLVRLRRSRPVSAPPQAELAGMVCAADPQLLQPALALAGCCPLPPRPSPPTAAAPCRLQP